MAQPMNRRGFLKGIGYLLSCLFLLPFRAAADFLNGSDLSQQPLKEAKYYTAGDDLAG